MARKIKKMSEMTESDWSFIDSETLFDTDVVKKGNKPVFSDRGRHGLRQWYTAELRNGKKGFVAIDNDPTKEGAWDESFFSETLPEK